MDRRPGAVVAGQRPANGRGAKIGQRQEAEVFRKFDRAGGMPAAAGTETEANA
jgi:hypothetical protein